MTTTLTPSNASPGACPDETLGCADFRSLPIPEMETILQRFEHRVTKAQQLNPPTKDRVKQAIRRQGTGPCPVRLKRLSLDIILRYGNRLADLFCAYPDDLVAVIPYDITIGYQLPGKTPFINAVEVMMRSAEWTDEWGTQWSHAFGGVGATPSSHPLQDWSQLDEFIKNNIPNPRVLGRLDSAAAALKVHAPTKYCYGIIHLALFERLHCLRGMQNLFMDFYTNEPEVRKLMEVLQAYLIEHVRMWAEIGADGVFMTDDWGSQTGLMISPDLWRSFFKPCYATVFEEIHRLGMDVLFHSCGNVMDIVGDLIDIGLDVLDPVQPGAMDIEVLAKQFGGHLAFSGAIDIQEVLCAGTPRQVKDHVRKVVDTLGRPFGGGLLLGPANVMTPDTPFENLFALFDAAHNQ
jgi:uroporphyrinogen decarboxylase